MAKKEYSKADVACSFQSNAINALIKNTLKAVEEYGVNTVTVGGGVGANGYLRDSLIKACATEGVKLVLPEKIYCTDNAAMIGAEGYLQYLKGNFADLELNAKASVNLD